MTLARRAQVGISLNPSYINLYMVAISHNFVTRAVGAATPGMTGVLFPELARLRVEEVTAVGVGLRIQWRRHKSQDKKKGKVIQFW